MSKKKKLNLNFQLSLSLLFPAKKKHARRCFRTNCSHASPGVISALKMVFSGLCGPLWLSIGAETAAAECSLFGGKEQRQNRR